VRAAPLNGELRQIGARIRAAYPVTSGESCFATRQS
jgi:hypothetical protein